MAESPPAAPPAAESHSKALNLRIRGFSFELRELDGRLSLRAPHLAGYGAICADWTDAEQRRRVAAGKKQLLAKAVGFARHPHPHVLDCTGGLGRDAFTLAALGASVTVLERSPVLLKLLEDAQARALASAVEPVRAAAARMTLIGADARHFLAEAGGAEDTDDVVGAATAAGTQWDVVLLDPMYPDDGKSALPSKEMQVLRDLTGGDPDADALLPLARRCARLRVAVKRPAKAPWLASVQPGLVVKGTQARFDVYLAAG